MLNEGEASSRSISYSLALIRSFTAFAKLLPSVMRLLTAFAKSAVLRMTTDIILISDLEIFIISERAFRRKDLPHFGMRWSFLTPLD